MVPFQETVEAHPCYRIRLIFYTPMLPAQNLTRIDQSGVSGTVPMDQRVADAIPGGDAA
jgi:hypothetical protein